MKKILFFSILFALLNLSCSVYETIVNISRLQFKLGNVTNFTLSGVDVSNKTRLQDFSALEILKISSAVAKGTLPVSFVLNVDAKNPNDGTGGYKKTNATLRSFPWKLFIDDKETISGDLNNSVTVPGTGEVTVIPLKMNLDMVSFFKDKNYESLINLALNVGGNNSGSGSSKLELLAKPVVATAIGDIAYPNEIKIISAEFTK
jgi:hypothetical protein